MDDKNTYRIQRPEFRAPLIDQNAPAVRMILPRTQTETANSIAVNTIIKRVSESITADAVLSNDSELQYVTAPNTKYRVMIRIFFDTTAAADFKYNLVVPAASSIRFARAWIIPGGAAFAGVAVDIANPYTPQSIIGGGANGGYLQLDGILHNGANGGVFAFQWCQDTSDPGITSVYAGSYLQIQQAT